MFGSIMKLAMWLIGLFFPSVDERDKERTAGETLGVAETNEGIETNELNKAQNAVKAGDAAGAIDDAGGVRDPKAGDRKWDPDALS